jgi:hypothetical protein
MSQQSDLASPWYLPMIRADIRISELEVVADQTERDAFLGSLVRRLARITSRP